MSEEAQWLQKLKLFLQKLLSNIIQKDEDVPSYMIEQGIYIPLSYYFAPDQMKIWAAAFTHETYSPTFHYEDLEYIGDKMLHAIFSKYLMKRFPELHKKEYTDLHNRYMSAIPQAEIARKIGLSADNRIRTKGLDRANLKLEGDVFESFFGALDTVSDNLRAGLGYSNCYNMITYLYENIEIKDAESHAKTQVQQIFTRFELSKPLENSTGGREVNVSFTPEAALALEAMGVAVDVHDPIFISISSSKQSDINKQIVEKLIKNYILEPIDINKMDDTGGSKTFTVSLSNRHLKFLESRKIFLPSNKIGFGEAPTKKEAENKAYTAALEFLSQRGITTSWAEDTKLRIDLSIPAIKQYIPALTAKLIKDGFKGGSFYFFIPRKTSDNKGAVVQLVGVRANGKHEVLSYVNTTNIERQNGYMNAKADVMKLYVEGNIQQ